VRPGPPREHVREPAAARCPGPLGAPLRRLIWRTTRSTCCPRAGVGGPVRRRCGGACLPSRLGNERQAPASPDPAESIQTTSYRRADWDRAGAGQSTMITERPQRLSNTAKTGRTAVNPAPESTMSAFARTCRLPSSREACSGPAARGLRARLPRRPRTTHNQARDAQPLRSPLKLLQRAGPPREAGPARLPRRSGGVDPRAFEALRDGVPEIGEVPWREIPRVPGAGRRLRTARGTRTSSTATGCRRSCRSSWRWAGR